LVAEAMLDLAFEPLEDRRDFPLVDIDRLLFENFAFGHPGGYCP